MLYRILRLFVKFALRVFYRRISVSGQANIPPSGPLIVVANHPNTLMDPLLVAAQLNREIYFLAKSSFFNTPFKNWLLRKLHMIPVYRMQDQATEGRSAPEMAAANQQVFEQCIAHLARGGTLMIFPEGTSILERRLRELKTGTARIALSAVAEKIPELAILPVGLNYSSATQFQSEVVMKIGAPVLTSAFAPEYAQQPWFAVKALTKALTQSLENLIIKTENEEEDSLLSLVEIVYRDQLMQELNLPAEDRQARVQVSQEISQSITWYKRYHPVAVRQMHVRIANYVAAVRRLGLHSSYLRKPVKNAPRPLGFVPGLAFLIFGFPLFVYGLLHNYLPYKLPGIAADKLTEEQEFEAPIMLAAGMFTFPAWYALCLAFAAQVLGLWWLLVYGLSLPATGFFALFYRANFLSQRGQWQLLALTKSRSELIRKLTTERTEILEQLEKLKQNYLQQRQGE